MPRKVFVAGEILTAADVNTNLMDQAVMVFDDSAARTTAIPTPSEGMVTYLSDVNRVEAYTGAAFVPVNTGFTAQTTITATNASFSVPSLAFPIVKVTVVGGGGGGGAAGVGSSVQGGTGGTTTFNAGGAGTVSATGGIGGLSGNRDLTSVNGTAGFASSNGGMASGLSGGQEGQPGLGGVITVAYLNLSGISTVNVTIGAGGTRATGPSNTPGLGGRGEVILEYIAS